MGQYAKQTTVGQERSREEIEQTLERYGAESFAYGWEGNAKVLGFKVHGRMVRFRLDMPERAEFASTPTGRDRTGKATDDAWKQAKRQRWRALVLVIKAKLEAVECGISTFEDEFLANTLLPDGSTVGEWAGPQLDAVYEGGKMPPLLTAGW